MQDYRKRIGVSGVLTGLIWSAVNYLQGDLIFATILLVLTGVPACWLAWLARPSGGGDTHATAQASAGEDDLIVYWRPGCIYCDRLRVALGRHRADVIWVDIHSDAEASEYVAGFHDGNRVVPTVVTGAGLMIDPVPAAIREHLGSTRPRSTGPLQT